MLTGLAWLSSECVKAQMLASSEKWSRWELGTLQSLRQSAKLPPGPFFGRVTVHA